MKLPLRVTQVATGFYNVKDALANIVATDLIREDAEGLVEAVNNYASLRLRLERAEKIEQAARVVVESWNLYGIPTMQELGKLAALLERP